LSKYFLYTLFVLVCLTLLVLPKQQANITEQHHEITALVGGVIYVSPDVKPVSDGVIIIQDDKIMSVGTKVTVKIPTTAKLVDCKGLFITAGFQNSHVHFTEPKWENATKLSVAKAEEQIQEMFTRYGFTTVIDTGSYLENTVALKTRIETGEIAGPRILTAGAPLYPPEGIPFYLLNSLPPEIIKLLDQPANAEQASNIVKRNITNGAEVIKLFTGSLIGPTKVKPMPIEIARAAVKTAHQQGKLVFTHPSNIEGIKLALAADVDVLAHTTSIAADWDASLIAEMKQHQIALIPTLKLWKYEASQNSINAEGTKKFVDAGIEKLAVYSKAGGQILFGTDVGYMIDYDPAEEYKYMSQAGLTPMQILASLTTAPAERFREQKTRGKIAIGMDADLVLLSADPAQDAQNLLKVYTTIRHGKTIYSVKTN
jgi:imidazolonepropionase-like amidohydrolase